MHSESASLPSRRDLLTLIGSGRRQRCDVSGHDRTRLCAESTYKGPIKLDGDPKGASVLILGAGLAGMVAALELRKAGYKVQILEYNSRPAAATGRCAAATLFTELGGVDADLRIRPGSLPQSRARGAFPITTAACWITASGWTSRSSRSSR